MTVHFLATIHTKDRPLSSWQSGSSRCKIYKYNLYFRPQECKISSGDNELFPLHSFGEDGLCLDNRLEVEVLEMSKKIHFRYRTFRFRNIKTIDQRHHIYCKLTLATEQTITGTIQNCTCYSNESCDSGAWSYWSNCDGNCKQTRIRNKDEADEETESRDCQGLCFFNVNNDIDENLKTCPIDKNRSKRDVSIPIERLSNGSTAYPGSLPYIVRLTFQTFDQFHSDSQACFYKKNSKFSNFDPLFR